MTSTKEKFRKLFAPLLDIFEDDDQPYNYRPSHRLILNVMGCIFSLMALLVLWFAIDKDPGYFLPVLVFGCMGFISLVIGLLGTDRAVAKIWNSR